MLIGFLVYKSSNREPKPEAVRFACCNERFEQPLANGLRDSRPGVLEFDKHNIPGFPGSDAELPSSRHRLKSIGNQIEKYALHATAN